jgi:hypothetical protein
VKSQNKKMWSTEYPYIIRNALASLNSWGMVHCLSSTCGGAPILWGLQVTGTYTGIS